MHLQNATLFSEFQIIFFFFFKSYSFVDITNAKCFQPINSQFEMEISTPLQMIHCKFFGNKEKCISSWSIISDSIDMSNFPISNCASMHNEPTWMNIWTLLSLTQLKDGLSIISHSVVRMEFSHSNFNSNSNAISDDNEHGHISHKFSDSKDADNSIINWAANHLTDDSIPKMLSVPKAKLRECVLSCVII